MAITRLGAACLMAVAIVVSGCSTTITGAPAPTATPGVGGKPSGKLTFRKVVGTSVPAANAPTGKAPGNPAERQSEDPQVQARVLAELDCAAEDPLRGKDDPALPLIACDLKKEAKYQLAPTFMTGKDVNEANAKLNEYAQYVINLELSPSGTKAFADFTAANVGSQAAFVLNTVVLSAPNIQQAITGGKVQISGNFTKNSAEDLVKQINGG